MTSITSEEVNYLVFRYLQEAGFVHSAFVFGQESFVNRTAAEIRAGVVPPGMLVSLLQRGLYYAALEFHLEEDGRERPCTKTYSLLEPHVCEHKTLVAASASLPRLPPGSARPPAVLPTLSSVAQPAAATITTSEEGKRTRTKSDPENGSSGGSSGSSGGGATVSSSGQTKKRKQQQQQQQQQQQKEVKMMTDSVQDEAPSLPERLLVAAGEEDGSNNGNNGRTLSAATTTLASKNGGKTTAAGKTTPVDHSVPAVSGRRRSTSREETPAFAQVRLLMGHESEVITCAWNPNEAISLLASASGDGTVRLWTVPAEGPWSVEDAQLSVKILDHRPDSEAPDDGRVNRDVTAMAWSADGQILATGCYDGKARLWSADGELLAVLSGHQGPIFQLQFCPPPGEFLATVGLGPAVVIWSLATRSIHLTLDHHDAPALDVDWRDAHVFATCSSDQQILLYDLATCQQQPPSPDNRGASQAHAAPARSLAPSLRLQGHTDEVNSIRWSPDGAHLASCSDDQSARMWRVARDLSQAELTGLLTGHGKEIYTIKWSRDGAIVATASFDGSVKVWDAQQAVCRATLRHHSQPVYAIAFSPCGRYLASGGLDAAICLWSLGAAEGDEAYRLVRLYRGKGGIFEVSWSVVGRRVAACTSDAALCVLEV